MSLPFISSLQYLFIQFLTKIFSMKDPTLHINWISLLKAFSILQNPKIQEPGSFTITASKDSSREIPTLTKNCSKPSHTTLPFWQCYKLTKIPSFVLEIQPKDFAFSLTFPLQQTLLKTMDILSNCQQNCQFQQI